MTVSEFRVTVSEFRVTVSRLWGDSGQAQHDRKTLNMTEWFERMSMSKIPIDKLRKIAVFLSEKLKPYQCAVRGTAGLVLQGYDMNADDVDVLCDKEGALACNELFKGYLTEEVSHKESEKFRSYFGKFEIDGVLVEVMGEWEIRDAKGEWFGPYDAAGRVGVVVNGSDVFVMPVEKELIFFAKMGRWNAYHKLKRTIGYTGRRPVGRRHGKKQAYRAPPCRLLLIDTFNFLHRAYHALPKSFRDASGEPTNAVYGVASMLISVLGAVKPDYVVAAVDDKDKATFRVEDFTGYKAHRKELEADLVSQIPKVFEVLDAFGIKSVLLSGYEADDVIGTLAKKFSSEKVEVVIVSNDRDLWQLVSENVTVMIPTASGGVEWIGGKEVEARMGFVPELIPDYKALRGDPSDNIPGVYGIGEKTAKSLIQKFGAVEEVYKNIGGVSPVSLKEKLANNAEEAVMSKRLATIIVDAPITLSLEECKYSELGKAKAIDVLRKYNFKSLIKRLGFSAAGGKKGKLASVGEDQISLFD